MNIERRVSFSTEGDRNPQNFKFRRQQDRALTNINTGKEIWYFKNEILKDIKTLEKNLTDKFINGDLNLQEEVTNIKESINSLNIKIKELSTKIAVNDSIEEKMNSLEKIKSKILDNILVNEVKVNTLNSEIRESIINMNNLLKETVIYPGVIGPTCKFKTFHDFIDDVINKLNALSTFREKNTLDMSSFKKKIDSSVQGFKIQMESIGRSSTSFINHNINILEKSMNQLFHKCDDKIDNIKENFDDKFDKINTKLEELENKLLKQINEIKEKVDLNEKNLNQHLKVYLNLREDVNKFNEYTKKRLTKRNTILNNLENNNSNKSNDINRNKIKKVTNAYRNKINEEIKNNDTNNDYEQNQKENLEQEHTAKDINNDLAKHDNNLVRANKKIEENEQKKSNDKQNLNDLNQNLEINLQNSNSFKISSKRNKKGIISSEIAKRNSISDDIDLEEQKLKTFTSKIKNIQIKNMKNNFNISHHSVDTANSKATIRAIDNLINFETIKPKNLLNEKDYKDTKNKKINQIKTPQKENIIINKTINAQKDSYKLSLLLQKSIKNFKRQKSLNEIPSLNIENNNNIQYIASDKYERFNYLKTNKSSTKFKNIILTLEGTKKMIYDTKNFGKRKNIYHIESLSNNNSKRADLRERLESCKPFLIKKNYAQNSNLLFGKEEQIDIINYKNHRLLFMNKSASSRVFLKQKHSLNNDTNSLNINNNNFSPAFNITKYNPSKRNKFKGLEEKSFQTEKNIKKNAFIK